MQGIMHEKNRLLVEELEDLEQQRPRKSSSHMRYNIPLLAPVCLMMMVYWFTTRGPGGPDKVWTEDFHETFELRLPMSHTNLVHQETVIQHSFGNSWGVPAHSSFEPPATGFNRVVLELNTTINGTQYDRLANIYIDDIPVWRTSTAEPARDNVFTSVEKDVSKYLCLFLQRGRVTFELDNLIGGRLNGVFETKLTLKYYLEEDDTSSEDLLSHITAIKTPALKVTQLIKPQPNRTPRLYYPADVLEFSIPKVNRNTTSLKLEVFISGNSEEEFWYTNVIDSKCNFFSDHGNDLWCHGPVRLVNVLVNNRLVSVAAPEPVIYSGGYSPSLWKPIIGANAFDVKSLEFDLTAAIPELWQTSAALDITVTNGTVGGHVGQNWIVGASLLHWESDQVEWATGEAGNATNFTDINDYSTSFGPGNLNVILNAKAGAELTSEWTYTLKDGSKLQVAIETETQARYDNAQVYRRYGDAQKFTSAISSSHQTKVKLGDKERTVQNTRAYPFALFGETDQTNSPNITLSYLISHVYGSRTVIDGKEVAVVESRQNGTSQFALSPQGNHGYGSTDQLFAADVKSPFSKIRVDSRAKAVNGTLIERDEKIWYDEVVDVESDKALTVESKDETDAGVIESIGELMRTGDLDIGAAAFFLDQMALHKHLIDENMGVSSGYESVFPGFRNLEG